MFRFSEVLGAKIWDLSQKNLKNFFNYKTSRYEIAISHCPPLNRSLSFLLSKILNVLKKIKKESFWRKGVKTNYWPKLGLPTSSVRFPKTCNVKETCIYFKKLNMAFKMISYILFGRLMISERPRYLKKTPQRSKGTNYCNWTLQDDIYVCYL